LVALKAAALKCHFKMDITSAKINVRATWWQTPTDVRQTWLVLSNKAV